MLRFREEWKQVVSVVVSIICEPDLACIEVSLGHTTQDGKSMLLKGRERKKGGVVLREQG